MKSILRPLPCLLIAVLGMGLPRVSYADDAIEDSYAPSYASDKPATGLLEPLDGNGILLRLDSAVLVPLEGDPLVTQGGFYLDDTQAYRIAERLKEANEALGKPPSEPLPPLYEQRTESPVLTAVLGITIGFALGITMGMAL